MKRGYNANNQSRCCHYKIWQQSIYNRTWLRRFKVKWEFPGGKIEECETGEEAVVREIKEELRSTVKILKFFGEINDVHGDRCFNVKFYICELVEGNLELTEHFDSKWAEPKEIKPSDFMGADKEILDKLIEDKEFK